jgi:hypothetical protein
MSAPNFIPSQIQLTYSNPRTSSRSLQDLFVARLFHSRRDSIDWVLRKLPWRCLCRSCYNPLQLLVQLRRQECYRSLGMSARPQDLHFNKHTALGRVFRSRVDESSRVAIVNARFIGHSIIVIVASGTQCPADVPISVSAVRSTDFFNTYT